MPSNSPNPFVFCVKKSSISNNVLLTVSDEYFGPETIALTRDELILIRDAFTRIIDGVSNEERG